MNEIFGLELFKIESDLPKFWQDFILLDRKMVGLNICISTFPSKYIAMYFLEHFSSGIVIFALAVTL